MPHEPFDAIWNIHPVEFREGRSDQVQCQRVHFEALRVIGIPVTSQMSAAGGALDDGYGRLDVLRDLAGKTQFRADEVVDRLQVHPTVRLHLLLATNAVGEFHASLGVLQSGERREAFDVVHFGIGTHHVRLTGEDENTHGLVNLCFGSGTEEKKERKPYAVVSNRVHHAGVSPIDGHVSE